jgi:hypothetical protein
VAPRAGFDLSKKGLRHRGFFPRLPKYCHSILSFIAMDVCAQRRTTAGCILREGVGKGTTLSTPLRCPTIPRPHGHHRHRASSRARR